MKHSSIFGALILVASPNEIIAAEKAKTMRRANISTVAGAAMVLALMGCGTDRAETPATEADTGTIQTIDCGVYPVTNNDYARALAVCREAA
ncbi:MAG: hypothetical protein KAR37_10100, partial [Alphaproteobacteria bacterium]|nr:hypothetical protein [Alphaproteobacteria bacterium]